MTAVLWHVATLSRLAAVPLAAFILTYRFSSQAVSLRLRAVLFALTAISALAIAASIVSAARTIAEWDFLCFWVYEHAAAAGANVYSPATYQHMTLPIPVDAYFQGEVRDVGFPYPPPSILLFLPLGYFANFSLASAFWLAVLSALFVAGSIAFARSYAGPRDIDAGVAIVALAISLPAVTETIQAHQTNLIAFACLAAAYVLRDRLGGGVAAGLAFAVKPYLIVVALWFALRRRWNAFAASIVTVAALTIAAVPALGREGLATYVRANPASRLPASLYAEAHTASLYAVLLRLRHSNDGTLSGPVHDPAFVAIALVLLVATAWLVLRAPAARDDLSLGVAVTLGLMLYGGTGTTYAVAVVPAIVALARTAGTHLAFPLALFALAFCIADASAGTEAYAAYAAVWFVAAFAIVRETRTPATTRA